MLQQSTSKTFSLRTLGIKIDIENIKDYFLLSDEQLEKLKEKISQERNEAKGRESQNKLVSETWLLTKKIQKINWVIAHKNIPLNQWSETTNLVSYLLVLNKEKRSLFEIIEFLWPEGNRLDEILIENQIDILKTLFPNINFNSTINTTRKDLCNFSELPKIKISSYQSS